MKHLILIVAVLLSVGVQAQQKKGAQQQPPKLVVGIVVDQMRHEYLYRFQSKYGAGGFNRFINDGFVVKNGHYNYAPTVTGPGHASVYTGTTPAIHGIVGNSWYDKESKKSVNCVDDTLYSVVGVAAGRGDVSPARMLSSTVTDELKLFTQKRAKVIGISIKDRGAALPAGHMADAAYWYDGKTGRFITSTYYMQELPDWVEKFNAQKLPEKYLSGEWNTLLPIAQYVESGPDDTPYEGRLGGKDKPVFPYDLKALRKPNEYGILSGTPFGNDYLTEMAKAAVQGENLGADDITDFLAISYSSTDGLGHSVGPNAVEIQDMYMRLDKSLEDLFKTLDAKVGVGNYTVFLTADHAVADVAQYMMDNKMPAGYFDMGKVKDGLVEHLKQYFPGKDLIETVSGGQIFFNHDAFQGDAKASGVELMVATELTINYLMKQPGVANAYSQNMLRQSNYDEGGVKGMVMRGYHPKRGGDIVIVLEPGWYGSGSVTGTTHGSPWAYDTHVPMLFYGKGIKKGFTVRRHSITDIAPTISALLNIKYPSGCTGQPIAEIFE
jgi:predicted AlkP superfamily pyrophosphatase or phosphodiesterase